ncbi:dTDP-4-dehydrorhamnose 3,5-epimerase family protein [Kutzneria sp. CA-103260]|uniref:dTDP-4-dehydrorhamnose 3,5-epimerase family protein n=1 Tax=Kutzneria sp. CA-103260 TaxID=2802641 RepID=UPI001BA87396|nr:dTDP-4-dehydrorhamnose 3,5-epimerase family protein [Kutzneria sp. CA-103260]QUQ65439.1 dTDP-4-dehydrorhamnose 3,5-epimerase [Kutzneria sp. CA-103260]
MEIEPLGIQGVFLVKPKVFPDSRGEFLEMFSQPAFEQAVGHPLGVAQVNCSASVRGTIRGLHGIALPGQARYMTCPAGAMVDIVVDTRLGSPTYRQHVAVELNQDNRHALYLAEGLVHGFAPRSESATVVYLCSSTWSPGTAYQINPLDPDLALPWPTDVPPVQSEKDMAAPSLRQAERLGLLPTWTQCEARYAELANLTAVN